MPSANKKNETISVNSPTMKDYPKNQVIQLTDNQQVSLPCNIEIENAILGALMLEKEAANKFFQITSREEVFYNTQNRAIFEAIRTLHMQGSGIDMLTVCDQLNRTGMLKGGLDVAIVSEKTRDINNMAHLEVHTRILIEYAMKRGLMMFALWMGHVAQQPERDVFELMSETHLRIESIENTAIMSREKTGDMIFKQTMQTILQKMNDPRKITGIPSGIAEIDDQTGGFQKTDLVIIAARPSAGKSALMISMIQHMLRLGRPVGVFSLEMSSEQLCNRMLATELALAGYNTQIRDVRDPYGSLNIRHYEALQRRLESISQKCLIVQDDPVPLSQILSQARVWKKKYNIEALYIDYLQFVQNDMDSGGTRETQVAGISRRLKYLAKELAIPVISLAQLSRDVEKRPDKRPILSDLRESGGIEQDADAVAFLYRPSYYQETVDADGNPYREHETHWIMAKQRNGELGVVPYMYQTHNNLCQSFNQTGSSLSDYAGGGEFDL